MINIVFFVTPNYQKNTHIINTTYKNITVVEQFLVAYHSIKKNWTNFNYDISLFHNKDYKFNETDYNKLLKLDINLIPCEPDHSKIPYLCRCAALTYKLPQLGTHRLILDCDVIAHKELILDLSYDWQAMFTEPLSMDKMNLINKNYKFNVNLNNYNYYHSGNNNAFNYYIFNPTNYKILFPYFNAGAYLIKENLCQKFVNSYKHAYDLAFDNVINFKQMGIEYAQSLALIKLSDNWKPFKPGINYIAGNTKVNVFGKDNISLYHYCGRSAYKEVFEFFPEYFEILKINYDTYVDPDRNKKVYNNTYEGKNNTLRVEQNIES